MVQLTPPPGIRINKLNGQTERERARASASAAAAAKNKVVAPRHSILAAREWKEGAPVMMMDRSSALVGRHSRTRRLHHPFVCCCVPVIGFFSFRSRFKEPALG